MFRFVYTLLGWALLVLVPSLLLYVYIMLYRELPEQFRARARKAFRHPAWAVHRSAGKFWRYSSQLQWFAVLFFGALALISIGEYGFGIFVLFLSSVSLLSKVAHWEGLSQNPGWRAFLKGLGSVGGVVLFS